MTPSGSFLTVLGLVLIYVIRGTQHSPYTARTLQDAARIYLDTSIEPSTYARFHVLVRSISATKTLKQRQRDQIHPLASYGEPIDVKVVHKTAAKSP